MPPRIPSVPIQKELAALRDEFHDYLTSFSSRSDFAPSFMKTYQHWHRATHGTFIAFVRALDPDVPAERAKYVQSRSWQAACYLKRLVEAPETQAKFRQSVSPFRLLSRVLRTLLASVEPSAYDAIWQAVAQSSHWRDRDLERLQRMTNRSGPLPLPHLPRLVKRTPR